MDSIHWEGYLKSNQSQDKCRQKCASAFSGQRTRIRNLFLDRLPKSVVCMGSGYLNDIPIEDFVKRGCKIVLVDWVRDLSRNAYLQDIVQKKDGDYQCLICQAGYNSQDFCANYHFHDERDPDNSPHYCDRFQPSDGEMPQCVQFVLGSTPEFLEEDVTQGVAGEFAGQMARIMLNAKNPKMAFKKALQVVRSLHRVERLLPIEDHSVDMVTSSMVVSQFDFEPYGFMEKNLAIQFGVENILAQEKTLLPYMNDLRDRLFKVMVDHHFREIHRILHPEGRAYYSSETFQQMGDTGRWFPVKGSTQALEILEKYFWFDFSNSPDLPPSERIQMYKKGSVVESHVLIPKADEDLPRGTRAANLL